MKINFQEMGIADKLFSFSNGKEAVDYINSTLLTIDLAAQEQETRSLLPVSLVLLDINMPIMDGMEAAKKIKDKFQKFNQ